MILVIRLNSILWMTKTLRHYLRRLDRYNGIWKIRILHPMWFWELLDFNGLVCRYRLMVQGGGGRWLDKMDMPWLNSQRSTTVTFDWLFQSQTICSWNLTETLDLRAASLHFYTIRLHGLNFLYRVVQLNFYNS